MVDHYYANQALPHFSGRTTRQRGSGIGALVAGASTIAIPLAKKYLLPVAKRFGRQLLAAGVSEAGDVLARRKTARQALKGTVSKAVKSQLGGSVRKTGSRKKKSRQSNQSRQRKSRPPQKKPTRKRKRHSSSTTTKRSRLSFFSNVDNDN